MAMRTLAFGEDLKGYKVVKKLVEEDAGAIYLAVDQVGTRLRLRMLSDVLLAEPFLRMRALEDLAKLQALKHPGVARFCAWHDGDPAFYAVVDPGGAPLQEVVSEGRALNEKELGWLGVRVAEALGALHKAGIPCGELSPANVTLTSTGPVITDLGWAARMRSSTARAMMSKDITGLGDLLRYAADADSGKLRVPGRGSTALAGEVAERLARSLEGALDGAAAARAISDTATDLGLLDPPEPDIEALLQLVEKPTELRPSQLGRLFGQEQEKAEGEAKAGDAPTAVPGKEEAAATAAEAKDATQDGAKEPPKEAAKEPAKDAAGKDADAHAKKSSGVAAALGASPKDSAGAAALPPGPAVSAPPPGRGTRTPPRPSSRPSSSAASPSLPRAPAPPPPPAAEPAGGRGVLVAGLLALIGLAVGFALGKGAGSGGAESAVQVEKEVRDHLDASRADQAKTRLLQAKSNQIRVDAELALQVAAACDLSASVAKAREAEQRGKQAAEAAAEQSRAAARKEAEGHASEGKAAQQRGEVEAAREAYMRALRADSQNAVAVQGLDELFRAAAAREPTPPVAPEGDPNAAEAWRRQQVEAALQAAQASLQRGEHDQAEGSFRLVKALDPEHPDALRGLAEVARLRDEAHQREAGRSADELVSKAQRALGDGRPGVAPMLDALEALDRALQLAPSHNAAKLERERLVTRLLAQFEEKAETDQLTGEGTGDPWLDVIELDRVVIDRGLGGGVRFEPTRVFRPLRERMRAESDGRYRAIIRVRSQVAPPRSGTPGAPSEVLVSGLEVALEDKVAKTCTPWEKLDLPGGPHYRTVRVDGRGRILAPFYSAHGMDVKGIVKRVETTFDRLVQAARTKAQ